MPSCTGMKQFVNTWITYLYSQNTEGMYDTQLKIIPIVLVVQWSSETPLYNKEKVAKITIVGPQWNHLN